MSAAATAQQLRQAFPEDPRGLVIDAQLKLARGQKDEAIVAFADLVKRIPEEPNFVYQYAQLLEETGRRAEAEGALRDLICARSQGRQCAELARLHVRRSWRAARRSRNPSRSGR